MTRSSGVDASLTDVDLIHSCGFEGSVIAVHDPEISRDDVLVVCPRCGADILLTIHEPSDRIETDA